MVKTILIFFSALVLLCSCDRRSMFENAAQGTTGAVASWTAKLPDGRSVICVSWKSTIANAGGVSCDWSNAK